MSIYTNCSTFWPLNLFCSPNKSLLIFYLGFPGGSVVKNLPTTANAGGTGFDPWVMKILWTHEEQTCPGTAASEQEEKDPEGRAGRTEARDWPALPQCRGWEWRPGCASASHTCSPRSLQLEAKTRESCASSWSDGSHSQRCPHKGLHLFITTLMRTNYSLDNYSESFYKLARGKLSPTEN